MYLEDLFEDIVKLNLPSETELIYLILFSSADLLPRRFEGFKEIRCFPDIFRIEIPCDNYDRSIPNAHFIKKEDYPTTVVHFHYNSSATKKIEFIPEFMEYLNKPDIFGEFIKTQYGTRKQAWISKIINKYPNNMVKAFIFLEALYACCDQQLYDQKHILDLYLKHLPADSLLARLKANPDVLKKIKDEYDIKGDDICSELLNQIFDDIRTKLDEAEYGIGSPVYKSAEKDWNERI